MKPRKVIEKVVNLERKLWINFSDQAMAVKINVCCDESIAGGNKVCSLWRYVDLGSNIALLPTIYINLYTQSKSSTCSVWIHIWKQIRINLPKGLSWELNDLTYKKPLKRSTLLLRMPASHMACMAQVLFANVSWKAADDGSMFGLCLP